MAEEFRVNTHELSELARVALNAAQQLGEARLNNQGALRLPAVVLGELPAASRVHAAMKGAAEALDAIVKALAVRFEGDADALYRAILNYVEMEERNTVVPPR